MTHGSRARPYLQSRWKALACPTLITITFREEAVPPPGRLGLYGWRRWQPNPPVTTEIWGNRQKMHRTQLIKVESQMCNNTGVQTPTYRAQEYQNHRHTNPVPPPSHPHTEANRRASIFDTKTTSSFCLNIWFSSQRVATSILTGPIRRETFAFSNSNPRSLLHAWHWLTIKWSLKVRDKIFEGFPVSREIRQKTWDHILQRW